MIYHLKKKFSKFWNHKLSYFNPFSVFVLILISLGTIALVKQQKISQLKQVVRVEVVGQNWSNNFTQYNGYRPPFWLVENLNIGSKEVAPDGRTTAEVVDIEYFERYGGNAQMFIIVELEVVNSVSGGSAVYKGGNIEIGETVELHLDNTFVIGQITDTNYSKDDIEFEELLVTGIYNRLEPYAANSIKEGMTVTNPFNGETYATIESVKVYPNTDFVVTDSSQNSVFRLERDYSMKNVEVTLRLVTEKHLGQNFYSGHQLVKIGENIELMFPEVKTGSLEVTNVSPYQKSE